MTLAKVEAHEWRSVTSYVLYGTDYELVPETDSDCWFVVDGHNRCLALSEALPLKAARHCAERLSRKAKAKGKQGKGDVG